MGKAETATAIEEGRALAYTQVAVKDETKARNLVASEEQAPDEHHEELSRAASKMKPTAGPRLVGTPGVLCVCCP